MKVGLPPQVWGTFNIPRTELMFVQDMPVKMAGDQGWRIPSHLEFALPLLRAVRCGAEDYVYLTVKDSYVEEHCTQTRPGWHTDGFGTTDESYLWYDAVPTEFVTAPRELVTVSDEDDQALLDMDSAFYFSPNIVTHPPGTLLRLNPQVVHRPGKALENQRRLFIKISVSKHRYDLEGNAHNHLFDYAWPARPRGERRNNPESP